MSKHYVFSFAEWNCLLLVKIKLQITNFVNKGLSSSAFEQQAQKQKK